MSGHCCQVEMGCEEVPNPCSCNCMPCHAARMRDEPSPPIILGAASADDVNDEYRRSCDAAVRIAERARIVTLARARAAQYMSDGWDQLADAVNNFAREIER